MKQYYSNGKLLITGEYMVLYGAQAFALPTRFGQSLEVFETPDPNFLHWETKILDRFWFSATIHKKSLSVTHTSDKDIARRLVAIIEQARKLNPAFLSGDFGYAARSSINFNINWGLGSSSSLLSNIAWWADIDPFELSRNLFKGSAYDIACARTGKPLLYKLVNGRQEFQEVLFYPKFKDHIYFVYTGRKQDTNASIQSFLKKGKASKSSLQAISEISNRILRTSDLKEFSDLLERHEMILSEILKIKPVKDLYFNDFKGSIKSLGAWGGDFILAVCTDTEQSLVEYFRSKDLYSIFSYDELILRDGVIQA